MFENSDQMIYVTAGILFCLSVPLIFVGLAKVQIYLSEKSCKSCFENYVDYSVREYGFDVNYKTSVYRDENNNLVYYLIIEGDKIKINPCNALDEIKYAFLNKGFHGKTFKD